MKNTILTILSLLLFTSCSDPLSFNQKGEPLPIPDNNGKGGGIEPSGTSEFLIFSNVDATTDTVYAVFRTNADSTANIVAFQGEVNWNENELELLDITTAVPTHEYSLFVWNDNMISGINYTDEGLRIAKFAYAGIDPVGVAGSAGLVNIKFRVIKSSSVCIKDFIYNTTEVDKKFCSRITKIQNTGFNI